MAGTDKTKQPEAQALLAGLRPPVVVLCEPQLGENIGTCARAMLNFGLTELRLVNPRDGWPNAKAQSASAGAVEVIDGARVFETVEEAVADLNHVYATTARPRDLVKPVMAPDVAAREMRALTQAEPDAKSGILFGRERWGLNNEEISLADSIITYPVNPAFASLNIGQAVLLMAYEWFRLEADQPPVEIPEGRQGRAPKQDIIHLYEHLESELIAAGFLAPPDKRPGMIRNLRALFARADLQHHEVQTLRGIIKSLVRLGERRERGEPDLK